MRLYPALVVEASPLDPDLLDRILAIVDDDSPGAVDEHDGAWRIFFSTTEARTRASDRLAQSALPVTTSFADVDDEDWGRRGQGALAPIRIGRIVVVPDETSVAFEAGVLHLLIPPSMGFGTGHHASTRLCLELLQTIPLTGRRVLDLGTGSGILAIAAAAMGAREVVGVDVDEDALTAARENLERNHTAGVALRALDLTRDSLPDAPFDVVLANLTGAQLVRYAERTASFAATGAHLIASGFQTDEAQDVHQAFARSGWRLENTVSEADWCASLAAIGPVAL